MKILLLILLLGLVGCSTQTPWERATGMDLPHHMYKGLEFCSGDCPLCGAEPKRATIKPTAPMVGVGEGERWHETGVFMNGRAWGRLGALMYVLDSRGKKVSDGYHDIRWNGNPKQYIGIIGATEERFVTR